MIKKHRMMFTLCVEVTAAQAAKVEQLKSNKDALALFKEVSTNDHTVYAVDEDVYEIESEAVSNKEVGMAREVTDFGMMSKSASKIVLQSAEHAMKAQRENASRIITMDSTKH